MYGGGSVSLNENSKLMVTTDSFGILNNISDPVILFYEGKISFANEQACELFEYDSSKEMMGLNLSSITSEFEKKSEYTSENTNSFLGVNNEVGSHRFRWIHRKKSGEHFYSEVISIQMPDVLQDRWPEGECVIITDLSGWNDLRSKAEKGFVPTRNIINNINKAIIIINPDSGLILDANSFATEFYGYTSQQFRRMNIGDINILDQDKIKEEMIKAKEEKRGHFLFKHRLASGEVMNVKVLSGPVNYRGQTALYSIVTTENDSLTLTKLMEYEQKVAEEQNIFESVFHHLQIPAAIFKPDMRIRAVNNAFLKEFGYKIKEVMNRHVTPLICPWEYIEEAEFFHRLVIKGNNIFEEVQRRHKDGNIKNYRINGFPLMYNGTVTAVVAVYLDVDAEKRAFFKLHLINKIFENIDEGMLITNKNGEIIWVNQAFQNITGYSFDNAVGEKPRMLSSGKHDAVFYQMLWHTLNVEGYWEGEVINRNSNGELYQAWLNIAAVKDKQDSITNYIGVMNDITKYKAQEEKIKHLAKTDVLTGLMNRSTFIDKVEIELKNTPENVKHAVLFIDLDDFKKINDMYGHDQGDKLLKIISYRLKSAFKSRDVLARIGGDEFIVLLNDIKIEQISGIIDRLFEVINRSVDLENQIVRMEASIGVAVYPNDATTLVELMKDADIALYHAKEIKGSGFEYYSKDIEKRFKRINKLEKSLKLAMENNELDVYYQGIVGKDRSKFSCAEALIRWENTELGGISPGIFIPIAERIGIMPDIGLWVLEHVLQDMKRWSFEKYLLEGVAVNISVTQLEEPSFCNQVKQLLDKYKIPAEFIEFEITESVYIRDFDQVVKVLEDLHDYGIRFTMDDFGTGYSSLSTIHKLNLSKIKIDRSFIRDLPGNSKSIELTNSIINLAQNLKFKVVAEGVEKEEQVTFLQNRKCNYIQGYFFSKPVNGYDFFTLLEDKI